MAFKSTPLAIAAISGVLLIAVLAVDATVDRTYTLEVRGVDGWKTVASSSEGGGDAYPRAIYSRTPIVVEDNGSVEFRLRIDNGYPWAFSDDYQAYVHGTLVGEGSVSASARGEGVASFTVDVADLTEDAFAPRPEGQPYDHVYVEVHVGGDIVGADVAIQEARA